jgi:erythritol transport system substrate-binding protein
MMVLACGLMSPPAPAEPDKALISILIADARAPLWREETGVAKSVAQSLGYRVRVGAHDNILRTEEILVDAAIAQGARALILDPAHSFRSAQTIRKAVDAGIAVFLIDSQIPEARLVHAQLFADQSACATMGASYWAQLVQAGRYVELFGGGTDEEAPIRSRAYDAILGAKPALRPLAREDAQGDFNLGQSRMAALVAGGDRPDGVIAGNDAMALGAIAALADGASQARNVVVGGFGGSPEAIQAVKAGRMAYTVLEPVGRYIRAAIYQADRFLRTGETGSPSERQAFSCTLITPSTATAF